MTTRNTNPAGNPKIGEVSGVLIAPRKDSQKKKDSKQPEPDLMDDLAKAKRRAKS